MFNSFLFSLLSFLFFSGNFLGPVDFLGPDYGEISKINKDNYFVELKEGVNDSRVSASSFVVLDLSSNNFVLEKEADNVWPIASISKLMSALVLLEDLNIDLDVVYKIKNEDRRVGGRDNLFLGDEVKNYDLLALALIASDNTAISALVSSSGIEEIDFVDLMNKKARSLDLRDTFFDDPTGLSSKNVSTAKETSILMKEALEKEEISDLVSKKEYKFITEQGRAGVVFSTNELLYSNNENINIIGGKTGYIESSGYCLGTKFSLNNKEFISVVLNATTTKNRFADTNKIFESLYNFYNN
jgi:serine-type D-Ala-D-Ala endopeptidase (penicillin-binding protein 7)